MFVGEVVMGSVCRCLVKDFGWFWRCCRRNFRSSWWLLWYEFFCLGGV